MIVVAATGIVGLIEITSEVFWVTKTNLVKLGPECLSFLLIFNLDGLPWATCLGPKNTPKTPHKNQSDASNSAGITMKRISIGLALLCPRKKTRNHLQGVFVQTKRWRTLGQAYSTAICMIQMKDQHLTSAGFEGLVLLVEAEQAGWVLPAPDTRRVEGTGDREKPHILYHGSLGGVATSLSTTYLVISQHDLNPHLLRKKNYQLCVCWGGGGIEGSGGS